MAIKIQKEIEELRDQIKEHDYNYYVLNSPVISDYEYDMLMKRLITLEEENPDLVSEDSPTQRVGKDIVKNFKAAKHTTPMLSLANTYSKEELFDFDRRVREGLGGELPEYVVELKIDGASLSLVYEGGVLKRAVTRGDGFEGEEITSNAKTIKSIPLSLRSKEMKGYNLSDIEVRGEVFMKIADFEKLNAERLEADEKLFANPRNSAAGTLKLQNPQIVSARKLNLFSYYLLSEKQVFNYHSENLEILKKLGFSVNPNYKLCKDIKEVVSYVDELEAMRDNLAYEIDGAVIKVNSIEQQKKLGSISKSPRWAAAYKFKPKQAVTLLKKIIWQVGRQGTITPVADLEPVSLGGSTISRATLHNIDEIRRKNIKEGIKVVIEKGGDVIPKIVTIIYEDGIEKIPEVNAPEVCPVCGSQVIRFEDEANYYCQNSECPAQIKGKLEHFASRGAMDIEGLGESIIDLFVEKGFLNTFADIYSLHLHRDELISIERFGVKSIDKLLANIEKSKQQPFYKLLYGIGIRYVGAGAARKLADHFGSINSLIDATEDQISSIYEIGESISKSVKKFFSDEHNLHLVRKLNEYGLKLEGEKISVQTNFFTGKTFVLTGTLERLTREEAGEKIIALGGKSASSVSKKTNYIIAGENAGGKLSKAKELGIEVLTEEQFIKLLEENS